MKIDKNIGARMRKLALCILLSSAFLMAEVREVNVTREIVESGIKVLDIRFDQEWKQLGIVKNSIPVTYLEHEDEKAALEGFIKDLNRLGISKDEEFAIICRTGRRTVTLGNLLSDKGYKVIVLQGSVKALTAQGYKLTPVK